MKLIILFLFASLQAALAQTNSIGATEFRTWTFQKGGKFFGKATGLIGTNVVYLSDQSGKLYNIPIPQLSTNDQALIISSRAAIEEQNKTAADSARKAALVARGFHEVTVEQIENYPEKTDWANVWIEGEFRGLSSSYIEIFWGREYLDKMLGFGIRDQEDHYFGNVWLNKEEPVRLIAEQCHRGDRIRVIGFVAPPIKEGGPTSFRVSEIQILKRREAQ